MNWPKEGIEETLFWRYKCCRSVHEVTTVRRGKVWFVHDDKRTIHRNHSIRERRIGPRKNKPMPVTEVLDLWHSNTCPNQKWCEYRSTGGARLFELSVA